VTQSRDFIQIGPIKVRHSTAARDWLCGTCGGKLATRWHDVAPNWRTVCTKDGAHDDQSFIHQSTYEYIEHRELMNAAQAKDVFAHLPAELQAAIRAAE
jgi:hypothetical protein